MEQLQTFMNTIYPINNKSEQLVQGIFKPMLLKKGEYFTKNGELASTIGFLKSGIIRAYYENKEGTEYNKHFFTDNSFVASYSFLITGKPNRIIQQALTDCSILIANYAELLSLCDSNPDVERFIRKQIELFFVYKEERELEIVLLDATERYEIFRREYPALEQLISQYHIAAYLGISPTQLSRIRKKILRNRFSLPM